MMQIDQVEPVAQPGCGEHLRKAREAAGLRQEDVAERLKMPLRVVQSLEDEDWSRLGAPVFVRGQLRSYSRLLGLPIDLTVESAGVAPIEPPALVTRNFVPRHKRMFEQFTHRAIYVVMTVSLVVPVWLATSNNAQQEVSTATVESLEIDAGTQPAFERTTPTPVRQASGRTPLLASITPMPRRPASAPALSLHLNGDSWVKVVGNDGEVLEQGLLAAGQTRSYAMGTVAKIVLGNAAKVEVEQKGDPVDLSPFMRANVARFTVSSDGSLAPVGD